MEETLAKHEQMLDEWMERNLPNAGRIPEENRYREVVSGETLSGRPKVQELLRRIESPKYKAVLIVEPQRLSRGDLEDIGRLVKLLRYKEFRHAPSAHPPASFPWRSGGHRPVDEDLTTYEYPGVYSPVFLRSAGRSRP